MSESAATPIHGERLVAVEIDARSRERMRRRAGNVVRIRFFETSIAVGFDDSAAAAAFEKRYRSFASDDPARLRISAVSDNGGAVFFIDGGPAYRWEGALHARGLEFLADCVMGEAYFSRISHLVSFHAAAVALDDVAIAITAASEGGKTTTAVACARRGMPLYSDELCILDGPSVQPYPRALNLREGSLALLAAECSDDRVTMRIRARQGEKWRNIGFSELFGGDPMSAPRPLAAIFFIDGRASRPRIESYAAAEALPRLLASPLRSAQRGAARITQALEILSRARAFRLILGTPDATARAIGEAVSGLLRAERCA